MSEHAARPTSDDTGWRGRLRHLWVSSIARTGNALQRFPVVIALILVASLAANLEAANYAAFEFEKFIQLEASLFAGAAGAVAAALFFEARGVGSVIRIAVQVLAGLVFALAVWFGLDWGVYSPALILGLTLAVPLVPYLGRGDGLSFWTFTVFAFVGVVLAFAAVLIFVVGVIAIIEMVAFLFDFDAGSTLQEHIFVTALTLVGPLFALGRIPSRFDQQIEIGENEQFVRGVALLAGWVSAPLALVAALVLYLYAAKIGLTGVVPKGEIGWIVSFFALLTILLRIAAEPIRDIGGIALKLFSRIWPFLLILPLGLLAYAVWLRIDAEGVTIARYYLALIGIGSAIVAALAIVARNRVDIRWFAGIPVALVLMSSFGPQGVASTVGRSQAERVAPLFGDAGSAAERPSLSPAERQAARSRIYALANVEQLERLSDLTDEDLQIAGEGPFEEARSVIAALGLSVGDPATAGDPGLPMRNTGFARPTTIDLSGYDRLAATTIVRADSGTAEPASAVSGSTGETNESNIGASLEGDVLQMTIGTTTGRFAIDPDALLSVAELSNHPDLTPAPVLDLIGEDGRQARLIVLGVRSDGNGFVSSLEADVLYRSDDWR